MGNNSIDERGVIHVHRKVSLSLGACTNYMTLSRIVMAVSTVRMTAAQAPTERPVRIANLAIVPELF